METRAASPTKQKAIQHGQDKLYEIRHGTHVSNRDGATLMSDWLDDWMQSLDHAHTTEKRYKSNIKVHIRPYFEGMTVAGIDVLAYRAFKKHIEKSLQHTTAQGVLMVLRMVLDDAVPRLIKTSPAEHNRKRGKFTKKTRERKKDLLPAVVESLARNAEVMLGYPGYVLVWTMAITGMRPAELYGLTREYCYPAWPGSDPRPDPDEEVRYEEDLLRYGTGPARLPAIRVERQVHYKDGGLQFFPPKYGSCRTLVVPPFLAEMLKKFLETHDRPWVFPTADGGSLGASNFATFFWRPIADGSPARRGTKSRKERPAIPEVVGFKGKRMYLLRHGHKAWLDEDGHSRFAVESRMGHEVPGVEGIYSSVTVPMEKAIMKSLQERWELMREKLDEDPL